MKRFLYVATFFMAALGSQAQASLINANDLSVGDKHVWNFHVLDVAISLGTEFQHVTGGPAPDDGTLAALQQAAHPASHLLGQTFGLSIGFEAISRLGPSAMIGRWSCEWGPICTDSPGHEFLLPSPMLDTLLVGDSFTPSGPSDYRVSLLPSHATQGQYVLGVHTDMLEFVSSTMGDYTYMAGDPSMRLTMNLVTPVPLPASWMLLMTGLTGVILARSRGRGRKA